MCERQPEVRERVLTHTARTRRRPSPRSVFFLGAQVLQKEGEGRCYFGVKMTAVSRALHVEALQRGYTLRRRFLSVEGEARPAPGLFLCLRWRRR